MLIVGIVADFTLSQTIKDAYNVLFENLQWVADLFRTTF